jgi:guanylate kinase
MIEAGELLEWEEIFGHRSGTPAEPVRRALEAGTDVLLELDVTGARHVRAVMPRAVLILLEPPTMEELEQREAFDVVIVNDDAERAADEVAAIIDASPQVDGLPEATP